MGRVTCPNLDRALMALHCGEPAEPDCPECVRALADGQRFVRMIERGLAGIRPVSPIAPMVMERLAAERIARVPAVRRPRRTARRRSWIPAAAAAAGALMAVAAAFSLGLRRKPHAPEIAGPVPAPARDVGEPPAFRIPEATPPGDLTPAAPPADMAESPPPAPPPGPPPPEPPPPRDPTPAAPPPAPATPPIVPERTPKTPRATTAAEPPAAIVAAVQRGTVTAAGMRTTELAAGKDFRAEGRARLALPFGTIDIDGGSVARFEIGPALGLVLFEGEARVDVEAAAPFELILNVPICPATPVGRFVAYARPDRIFIEEGAARAGGAAVEEGIQYRLAPGKAPIAERRTLGGEKWRGAGAYERRIWAPPLDRQRPLRGFRIVGLVELNGIRSVPVDNPFHSAQAEIASEEMRLVEVRPNAHLRFRYRLGKPGPLMFQMWDVTKRENFQVNFERPVGDSWTTVTLRLTDVPVNPGGRRDLAVEAGDVLSRFTWFAGRPGQDAEVHVRDLQVLEIIRPSR